MSNRKNPTVVKSNNLIEATYRLSLAEQRLLLLVISKLDSRGNAEPRICHTITAKEIAGSFHVGPDAAYLLLKEVADSLFEKAVLIQETPHVQLKARWVSALRYRSREGSLDITLSPDLLPYLINLKARFTRYHLESVARMTSIYAVRLYELLVQWREAKERTIELGWLRDRFDLADKYQNIRDFKIKVLNPSVQQINAHSDLWVKWEQEKRGRVVHALIFTFGSKSEIEPKTDSQTPSTDKPAAPKLTRAYIAQHALPGETWEQAEARLRAKAKRLVRDSC